MKIEQNTIIELTKHEVFMLEAFITSDENVALYGSQEECQGETIKFILELASHLST